MKEKIIEMLKLQDKLNTMTSGENWRDGVTNKWKVINWRRCMYMEMVEAIDSTPWKHWKAIEWKTDIKNFQIELVDIWHFLMSELLRNLEIEQALSLIEKYLGETYPLKLPVFWDKEENLMLDDYLKPYEDFIRLALNNENNIDYLEDITKQFFLCLDASAMTFIELYKLYIGKNVLNKFRQDHGYKEWTYKKIWNNWEEDNVTMQQYIEDNEDFTFDDLYKFLEKEYEK